jgi:hypothetical protein
LHGVVVAATIVALCMVLQLLPLRRAFDIAVAVVTPHVVL